MLHAQSLTVLMIALGDEILTGWGDARERHLEYASKVKHLHVVAYSPRKRMLPVTTLSEHLTVYPTRTASRPAFILDAAHMGTRLCRSHSVNVITVQDPFTTGLVGAWLRWQFGLPLHIQSHSDFFDNRAWIAEKPLRNSVFNLIGKWVLQHADTFRVVNRIEKQKYVDMGIPDERIEVVPVPVRLGRFSPEAPPDEQQHLRARLKIPMEAPVLLWVGRPVAFKALPVLIEAFVQVRHSHPQTILVLGGDFSRRPDIYRQIERLEIQDAIRFPGPVAHEDLPAYYRMASVYTHASRYEGFGMVMVEAGASGIPVIAPRSAGAQEIIKDGETGLLCNIDDPSDMAAAIQRLLDDPSLAKRLGLAAHFHVTQRFNHEAAIQAVIDEWRRTAALHTGRRS